MLQINNPKAAKKSARALEKFLAKSGIELSHGKALDAIAVMAGHQDWNSLASAVSPAVLDAQLDGMELVHAEDAQDLDYGAECAAVTHTGFELRYSAEGELLDYVRVCDPLGREIAYWNSDEWQEDPQLVMGAILGALMRGRPELRGKASLVETRNAGASDTAGASTLDLGSVYGTRPVAAASSSAHAEVRIQDVPLEDASNVLINGVPYAVRYRDTTNLALLQGEVGDPDAEADAHHAALEVHRIEDGLEWEESVTLATLRSLTWDAAQKCFVSADGDRYEFFIEQRFSPAVAVRLPVQPLAEAEPQKPARSDDSVRVPKLYSVDVSAAEGHDSSHLGTWFGVAFSQAEAEQKAMAELWDDRLDGAGCSASLDTEEQDEAEYAPFEVLADGSAPVEVVSLALAISTAHSLLSNAGHRRVRINTVEGSEVLKLKK